MHAVRCTLSAASRASGCARSAEGPVCCRCTRDGAAEVRLACGPSAGTGRARSCGGAWMRTRRTAARCARQTLHSDGSMHDAACTTAANDGMQRRRHTTAAACNDGLHQKTCTCATVPPMGHSLVGPVWSFSDACAPAMYRPSSLRLCRTVTGCCMNFSAPCRRCRAAYGRTGTCVVGMGTTSSGDEG